MKIENLIKSLGTAVNESQKITQTHLLKDFLKNHFETNESAQGEEIYTPKMIRIEMPHSDDEEGKVVFVPTATLVKHKAMNIDYVKLNLNIGVENENNDELHVTSRNLGGGEDFEKAGELEIMFKSSDSPEGVARVETQLNSML